MSNLQRETKEVITKEGGIKATMLTYITAREAQEIAKKGDGSATDGNNEILRIVLKSFDGSEENIMDRLLDDHPFAVYTELSEMAEEIVNPKKK